jgi:putative SOS response-associated peptidase YedK
LILADGFFEWRHSLGKTRGPSSPFYFQLENRKPFAFAGLWEFWNSPFGDEVYSATIITCAANDLVGQYHERMPVILDKDHMWDWLADGSLADLQSMLRPYPEEAMTVYPVSPMVNSPAVDSPEVIQPVQ